MRLLIIPVALLALLAGGCAGPLSEGERETQAMTDMDGRPIDPGRSGLGSGARVGVGIGVGSWGRSGGAGIGIGF